MMLFKPERSRLLLVNAQFWTEHTLKANTFDPVWTALVSVFGSLGPGIDIAGFQPAMAGETKANVVTADALTLWRNGDYARRLAAAQITDLTIAGAWLDEEVMILALQAAVAGFDVRVLVDACPLRDRRNGDIVRARLTASGVLCATVRQTLLEAAVSSQDLDGLEQVRAMLSKDYLGGHC